ncbi:MFS transporter [Gracilinema caldarium]|uniref:MFS transporter n=1 Tax=Gracilinema caldarium TaxID=215591 RepID=UPI0026EAEDD0|nr:MFS transporter [Gracilinema caldarium]
MGEVLAIAGFGTSTPIIPFFLGDLGITDPQAVKLYTGLLQTLPAISMMIMAPIWGSLADQFGRKPMLLRAMFGGAVILCLQGFVSDPWQLLLLRTIQGMLTGTVGAATVLVASVSPEEERGYALGLLQMSIFLGNSLGPLLGGYISDFYGHRINFFATAILLLLGGFIVSIFATDDFSPPAQRKSFVKSLVPDFSPLRGTERKALWTLLAIVAADQVAGSITSPFLPLFIKTISTASARIASDTGLVIAAAAISSSVAAVLIGKISYRLGYRRTLVFCMGGAALFTLPQAFVSSVTQLLVLRVMSSFFIGGNMPSVNALIAVKTPREKQGSMYGLRSSVASAGGAIGPAIGSALAIGFGYGAVFIATGTVLAIAGIAVPLFVSMREKREKVNAESV